MSRIRQKGLTLVEIMVAMVLGLVIIGGVIAAPFSAYVTKYLPPRIGLILVGVLVMGLSARGIILALMK